MKLAETVETSPTCGDHGGRTDAGRPCRRPAGWGREAPGGRCSDHLGGLDGRIVGRIDGDAPPAPDHLSKVAAERWRELVGAWIFGPGELMLLEEALGAWDRVRECRDTLQREGLVAVNPDSGNMKRHPAAQELDASLQQLRICLKQLDLEGPE